MKAISSRDVFASTEDPAWVIEDAACDPLRESSRESRFAVSNGFLGVRCSRAMNEPAHPGRPPGTYVAGLFDTASPDGPIAGLVPAPGCLQLHLSTDADSSRGGVADFAPMRMVLDMRRGLVLTECRQTGGSETGLHVRTLHLVSLHARAIGLQLVEITAPGERTGIMLEAFVDRTHLGLVPETGEQLSAVWRTTHSGKRLGLAIGSSLETAGVTLAPVATAELATTWHWTPATGDVACFERIVAVARGDTPISRAGVVARGELERATQRGRDLLLSDHEAAWAVRWDASDVVIDGDEDAQRALRFALYHLNGAADPTDEHVSIGARALTGEDYHGHVFWDTEIYLVPFYTMTWPEAARALLMYRFHTIAGARAKAASMGYRGALYAWESADTGAETAPEQVVGPDRQLVSVLSGRQEQHISVDVAYAVWHYWQATRDEKFLLEAGAQILLETARFWAGRATLEADGRRHIRGVIGPDEYHENVDDNAYTNVLASWNILRGRDVAALLRDRWPARWTTLSSELGLVESELDEWRIAAETIVTGFDPQTMLYEQFAGYFDLEDIDLTAYAGRSVPMDVVLGRERTQRSQVLKQADVVALLALLPEAFPGDAAAANFRYYAARCGHGSSLSRALHAVVAARLGDTAAALQYFEETAEIDSCDTRAAVGGGIHIAAQGGMWLTAVFGFSGLACRDDGLALDPHLPEGWRGMTYRIRWRGRRVRVEIDTTNERLDVTLEDGDAMPLIVRGKTETLQRGERSRTKLTAAPS